MNSEDYRVLRGALEVNNYFASTMKMKNYWRRSFSKMKMNS